MAALARKLKVVHVCNLLSGSSDTQIVFILDQSEKMTNAACELYDSLQATSLAGDVIIDSRYKNKYEITIILNSMFVTVLAPMG